FTAVELDYRAEVEVPQPLPTTDWDMLKQMAPNPLAPTYEQAMAEALTPDERARLEAHIRAALAAGSPSRRTLATAHLRATRPCPRRPAAASSPAALPPTLACRRRADGRRGFLSNRREAV